MSKSTLVTFLLDRSGSMGQIWDETIGGFNVYLDTLKNEGKETGVKFTLLQFSTDGIARICVAEPIDTVKRLDKMNYQPGGGTPLIDAAFKTITAVEESLSKYDVTPKVIVCIQTDGQENSSTEHTWDELKRLISEKTENGWQFNFMGTGIDAYDQSAKMGISAHQTLSTGLAASEVKTSFRAAAAASMRFASGASPDTRYLMTERAASGDKHFHKHGVIGHTGPNSVTPSLSLDLTASGGSGVSRQTSKRATLADISL